MPVKTGKGFSKLSKEAKMEWIVNEYLGGDDTSINLLKSYWHSNTKTQKIHDEFIENTITNFYIPFGVAPNFLINDRIYCVPMAIEESSVVAAAAKNASFWMERGGFKSTVISTLKIGHVHFAWYGDFPTLKNFVNSIKDKFYKETKSITANMRARGGGIKDINVIDRSDLEPNYYQLEAKFETCDAMGANFINSLLEEFAKILERESNFGGHSHTINISYQEKKQIDVDIGFIVFNENTYPNLIKFFKENKIKVEKSNMSFSVSVKDSNIEYCGKGVSGVF